MLSLAEMQAMALSRCRFPAPTRGLAKLPGIGLFDPLGEMRVSHAAIPCFVESQHGTPLGKAYVREITFLIKIYDVSRFSRSRRPLPAQEVSGFKFRRPLTAADLCESN
jgi:hypothetical protein